MPTRRRLLAGLAGSAVLAAFGSGCAGPAPSPTAAPVKPTTPSAPPVIAAATATTAARPSATLKVAMPFPARGLDPAVAVQSHGLMEMGLGEALLRVTARGEIVPWLAERVEPIDAVRWRVKLRDGAKFWNGRPVDAEAVRRSLGRTLEKNASAAGILPVAKLEVVDQTTLVIETRAPNGAVPSALANYFLTIHDAEEAARVGDETFNLAPQMTGPFRPVEFRPTEITVVQRHDGYWGGTAGLDRVEFRAVADGNARLTAVLAGDVQVARQIPPQGVAQAKGAGLAVQSVGSAYVYHLFLNNRRPPFDDPAVRRAMSLAVDRQALVDRVLNGSGQVATGAFPRFLPFSPGETFQFDPARARALLEDAGWKAGPDGTRVKEGRKLAFVLLTYPQRPDLGLLATAIQAMLRDVGVVASITSTEDISTPVDKGDYDAAMYAWQTAPAGDPGFALNLLYYSKGARNGQIGYRSARLDAVVEQLAATAETPKRHELAVQAQAILRDESPVLHLVIPNYHTALSSKVRGYELHPVEMYFLDRAAGLA